jgi:CheY-like chemotaxis protein
VGLLASSVAHDFNNHLAVILGYSEDLLQKRSGDEMVRNDAWQIYRASQRAGDLTRQLLNFARRETRKPQTINLNSMVSDSRLFLSRLVGDSVEFLINLDPKLAPVHADLGQVEQILMNLVANAKDAMPAGGKLVVQTDNKTATEAVPAVNGTMPPGNYVTLSVSDSGDGMDSAMVKHIFEPFFTTKDPGKGTGLGLATVFRNTVQADGYILVDSERGRGTKMTVCFPVAGDRAVSAKPAPPMALPEARTVLLAEDEDSLRALMTEILRLAGYQVQEASTGDDALAIGSSTQFDVLVSDFHLPGLHGAALVRELRKSKPELKVLFVTGDPSQTDPEPETRFLTKPFTSEDLLKEIKDLLD